MLTFIAFSVLSLILAAFTFQADAAPHHTRQLPDLGNLRCNTARIEAIVSLIAAEYSVLNINTTNPTTVSAVAEAQSGFGNITQGIETFALALASGQVVPLSAHKQIGNGMVAAQTALATIHESDPTVILFVNAARGNFTNAMTAGEVMDDNCPE